MKIHLFYCTNSIERDEIYQCCSQFKEDVFHYIDLPCSGKLTIPYLMKAFEAGAEGVLLLTCKAGDCHYLQGNLRARKRVEMVAELLDEIGIGGKHISIIQRTDEGGIEQVKREIEAFLKRVNDTSDNQMVSSPK